MASLMLRGIILHGDSEVMATATGRNNIWWGQYLVGRGAGHAVVILHSNAALILR